MTEHVERPDYLSEIDSDRRRLLGDLFSLASTAAPARKLRTFGAIDGLLARHARLGDE